MYLFLYLHLYTGYCLVKEHLFVCRSFFVSIVACVAGGLFGVFLIVFCKVRDWAARKLNRGRKRKWWGRGWGRGENLLSSPPPILGTLRSDDGDGDGNGNATKEKSLISKTTILHVHHAFLYISLPSLHDYDVKMPNFTMYRGSTQATTKFPLSFWTWVWFLGIQL